MWFFTNPLRIDFSFALFLLSQYVKELFLETYIRYFYLIVPFFALSEVLFLNCDAKVLTNFEISKYFLNFFIPFNIF